MRDKRTPKDVCGEASRRNAQGLFPSHTRIIPGSFSTALVVYFCDHNIYFHNYDVVEISVLICY